MSKCNSCCEIVKLTESNCSEKAPLKVQMSTIALLKNLLYLMNNCTCCCEIVKLKHLP